mgnify:CR=1 FL=1
MAYDLSEFEKPDWLTPVPLADMLAAVPDDAMMRGMYTAPVCKQATKITGRQYGSRNYIAFKFYPMREHIQVVYDCAKDAYPDVPERLALKQLATLAIPTLQGTLVGRTLLTLSGGTIKAALQILVKAYLQSRNMGTVRMTEFTDTHAVIEMRGIPDFPDSIQVGIMEEALKETAGGGEARVKVHSLCDVDVLLEWKGVDLLRKPQ